MFAGVFLPLRLCVCVSALIAACLSCPWSVSVVLATRWARLPRVWVGVLGLVSTFPVLAWGMGIVCQLALVLGLFAVVFGCVLWGVGVLLVGVCHARLGGVLFFLAFFGPQVAGCWSHFLARGYAGAFEAVHSVAPLYRDPRLAGRGVSFPFAISEGLALFGILACVSRALRG